MIRCVHCHLHESLDFAAPLRLTSTVNYFQMDKVTLQKVPAILLLETDVDFARTSIKHLRCNPKP